ncbi:MULTISPECIES: chromosome partitioning protein [Amycolatopsis]|uniref:MinD-like ATPase involved in chromosome partitioning or flagellar assembly n=2 Tax=Amycolatopsis TaxID=1813 RepID=A0A1I4ADF1_9PSEU|nr:chromosome partitioning protein [Amycolatopsis sacchari]SFK53769.1 hypothetical protein SAMN05421835_123117 [Amycolatopsis sacchari]
MLITVCSAKASPGVTVTALALAARWPTAEAVMVEADPSGGDLVARFRLSAHPGLVSLAAAARHDPAPGLLLTHSQQLPGGLRVVPGPVTAEQARGALDVLASRGIAALQPAARDPNLNVVVDVGRLDRTSPALPLVRSANAVLMLARPRADELSHLMGLLPMVPVWTAAPALVLIGSGYPRAEIERELRIPVLGVLPDDPRGARTMCGSAPGPGPDRSRLGRAVAALAGVLHREVEARMAQANGQKGAWPVPSSVLSSNGGGPR